MQVKTQKQVMVLQSKAQKVADKLNEEYLKYKENNNSPFLKNNGEF
jgi:hypothetical protein